MAIDKKKIFDYLWIPSLALGVIAIKVIASNPNLVQNIFPTKFPSKGKSVLFLGDSHTFPNSGWAEALVRKSGFKTYNKRAKNGANTSWMLGELTTFLQTNKAPDYLVVWGGANDAYGKKQRNKSNFRNGI
jgi:lysophospholipase L1-like esterase